MRLKEILAQRSWESPVKFPGLYYGRLDKRIVMVTCCEDMWMINLVHEL